MFTTIVADPPWPYDTPGKIGARLDHRPNRDLTLGAGNAGSRSRYGAMSLAVLKALLVPSAQNAHLYLWTTNKFIAEAHDVAESWGFRPITVLTWVKVRHLDGQPSMKMGTYFRGATEHIVFAVKGSLRLQTRRAIPTAFLLPREPHSQKPDAIYAVIEEASPGPYLEMFARSPRHGWGVWGNEVESDVVIPMR